MMATAPHTKALRRLKAQTPRYEPILDLPPLPPEQYEALRDHIALKGVRVPILVDGDGPVRGIIDGNHRKRIADELGYECPEIIEDGLSDQEKRTLARALNLARRQLDQAGKRALIADQLRETPGRSNRWVGKQLGVHHATVAAVRADLEGTGQIIQLGRTMGADGKYRPASSSNGHSGEPLFHGHAHESDGATGVGGGDASAILAGFSEEAILRAAAEIRQRRVADQLRKAQERRRQAATISPKRKRGSLILHGDCLDLIPTLEDGSVSLVVTSPPYAEQRKGHYDGVPEGDYPEFTVQWMDALRPKLNEDGSVLIVIRPHLRDGVLSDYVLRTRLALREAGWNECEEMIWYKPDAPPLGSLMRPRRTWESILWFSMSSQPYCDLKACGRESDRLGFDGSLRFGMGDQSPLNGGQNPGRGRGVARVADVVVAPIGGGGNDPGVDHPAVYPIGLAEQLIRTFSRESDLVLDPFCGSGQTLLAAKACSRRFLGIEREERYVRIALERLGR